MERNFVLGAVVVCAVALVAATTLQRNDPADSDASGAEPDLTRGDSTPAATSAAISAKPERQSSSPIQDRRDDSLLAHVEHKYRYLISDVESAHVEELRRRLLEHEGELSISRRAKSAERVSELLLPREVEYYEALRDSDLEQHHLAEYVGGAGNVAPLDERQEREVLDAKLRQKQRYAAMLRDMGLDRDSLSETEREYAIAHVAEALKGYLDDFLAEVSPALTPEQYDLLRNYETTEFTRELERLQRRINAK